MHVQDCALAALSVRISFHTRWSTGFVDLASYSLYLTRFILLSSVLHGLFAARCMIFVFLFGIPSTCVERSAEGEC